MKAQFSGNAALIVMLIPYPPHLILSVFSARALFRLLEWRYHRVPWPHTSAPSSQLLTHILKRINEASGIYQMFSILGDVIILRFAVIFSCLCCNFRDFVLENNVLCYRL